MSGDQIGSLAYLVLLGLAVGGWVVVSNRGRLGRALQHAAVWAMLFLGAIAAVGLWDDIRSTAIPRQTVCAEQGRIELPRARDGHFYATVEIQGQPVRFVVDTGATDMVLARQDAARLGLHPEELEFTGLANTANGTVRTAPVRLEQVAFGPWTDTKVRALVNGAEMETSLLGMGYLDRFERIEITRDRMILTR